ncbi:MAG: hypothetical protein ABJA71_08045 [Ginsengibacter sp.]
MQLPRYFLLLLLFCITGSTYAQPNWKYNGYFNFGCNINLTYGKSQQFPGIKLYAAFIANGVYKKNFLVNYGPSLSVYTNTLGSNLNPLKSDIQIDLTNSFSLGAA